jgi:hypothetical protein
MATPIEALLKGYVNFYSKPLNQRIEEAQARGNKKELERLNMIAGVQSATVGAVTGLPDLGIAAYNWKTGDNIKELRTKFLEGAGIPTKAIEGTSEFAYNAPDYALMAFSLGSLAKSGVKGIKNWRDSKRAAKFLEDLGVEAGQDTANFFKTFMATGQGADNPKVIAALDIMKRNPKYSELFTALDKAAAQAAVKGVSPTAGKGTEQAATGIVKSIQDKLEKLTEARNTAGEADFNKAYAIAGDRRIIDTEDTYNFIQSMRKRYGNIDTPSSSSIMSFLDKLEDMVAPRVTMSPTQGTSILREGRPDIVYPGSAGRQVTRKVPETVYDAVGMPRTVYKDIPVEVPGTPSATVRGTPDVTLNIPGASGYTTRQSPQKFSVPQLQQLLHEFGKKIGTDDSIIKGISQSDLDTINKGIFASLKTDLEKSLKTVGNTNDQQALSALLNARDKFRSASDEYNKIISKGIPKYLQGKSINEIEFEDLAAEYKKLNSGQRTLFREWVSAGDPEALKTLDNDVFQGFLNKAYRELPDGTMGMDLGKLAREWDVLKNTDKNQSDMLMQALGTNANEFSSRMKDALVFSRRVGLAGEEVKPDKFKRVAQDVGRGLGATVGYTAKQASDLTFDIINQLRDKSISPDIMAKVLLTKEGADFLKTAKVSGASLKTLEELTKLEQALPASKAYTNFSMLFSGTSPFRREDPNTAIPDDLFEVPADLMSPGAASVPDIGTGQAAPEDEIPDDLFGTQYPTEASMKQDMSTLQPEALTPQMLQEGLARDNPGVSMDELLRRLQRGENYNP